MEFPARSRLLVMLFLAGEALLLTALVAYYAQQSRQQHELRAQVLVRNVAGAVDQNIANNIDKIDLVLRTVTDELERQLTVKHIDRLAVSAFLARYERRSGAIEDLKVTDSSGAIMFDTGSRGDPPAGADNRDDFIRLRDQPYATLTITKSHIDLATGEYRIDFVRRYNNQDGGFAGVVTASVPLSVFAKLMSGFDLGERGTIALRHIDLTPIARLTAGSEPFYHATDVGPGSPELRELVDSGIRTTATTEPIDSLCAPCLTAFRRMARAPIVMTVSLPEEDYLGGWRSETVTTSALAIGILLISAVLAYQLARNGSRDDIAGRSVEQIFQAQRLAGLGSFDWNPQTGQLDWSEEHYRLWGLAPNEGKPNFELFRRAIHPGDLAETLDVFQQALKHGGSFDHRHRLIWPDGSEHVIRTRGDVELDESGQAIRMLGTVQDVTDQVDAESRLNESRHQSEQALLANENCIQEILNAVNDAFFIHDPESGRIVDVNQRLCDMFGYTREEALACTIVDLCAGTPPFSPAEAAEKLRRTVSEGRQTFHWLARTRKGHCFWVEMDLRLVHMGTHRRVLAVVHDIAKLFTA